MRLCKIYIKYGILEKKLMYKLNLLKQKSKDG